MTFELNGPEFYVEGETSLTELYRQYRARNHHDELWNECAAFQEWLELFYNLFESETDILETVMRGL